MKKKLIHILIFFLIFCAIILTMGLFNWGALPKAQDDPQTIVEAINEAIATHESDPTAHLGDGESLEQHKSNDVIDHLAGSIVPDKFSNAQSFLSLNVYPFISDSVDNGSGGNSPPFIYIQHASPLTGYCYYYIADFSAYDVGYDDGDVLIDFITYITGASGSYQGEVLFGFGKIQLKSGYYRIGYFTTSWQYSNWIALDVSKPLRFRFQYDSVGNMLYVFLRNTQVFSVSYTLAMEDDQFLTNFNLTRGSSSSAQMYLGNYQFWFDGM